jgi:uncharacterized protein (TIGR01777 family)
MHILVTGATGLVGSKLLPLLKAEGHEVTSLTRRAGRNSSDRTWNPDSGSLPASTLEGIDAVIHLAGENIGDSRWTAAKKKRIRDSRVIGTRLLAEAAAKSGQVKAFVSASAIGFYGDRGNEELTEASSPGTGFLPNVCREWESAAEPARAAGIRVVNLRLGVVMAKEGGALAKMLLPFKMCVGGIIGSGQQYWSWLTVNEAARMFQFAVNNESLSGPVNAVAPSPSTNYEFTKALGRVLHRPTIFPLPGFVAKVVLGEMAQDLILASTRVLPTRLKQAGYQFADPDLEKAIAAALS